MFESPLRHQIEYNPLIIQRVFLFGLLNQSGGTLQWYPSAVHTAREEATHAYQLTVLHTKDTPSRMLLFQDERPA